VVAARRGWWWTPIAKEPEEVLEERQNVVFTERHQIYIIKL
jgi:hypothetical protein